MYCHIIAKLFIEPYVLILTEILLKWIGIRSFFDTNSVGNAQFIRDAFRKIAKREYQFRHVCLSVCLTVRLSVRTEQHANATGLIFMNFYVPEFFFPKICRENSHYR